MNNTEFQFKLTWSVKDLKDKPPTNAAAGKHLKGMQFNTGIATLSGLREKIEHGYTLTYLYKKEGYTEQGYEYFIRRKGKKYDYIGTQFICVDIDGRDEDPDTFVSKLNYKPTVYHTTFGNLTARKNYKWCFHMIYIFDDIIYGEDYFNAIFKELVSQLEHDDGTIEYDTAAKDAHRCIFTTNSTFKNYVYREPGYIYSASAWIKYVEPEIKKIKEKECKKSTYALSQKMQDHTGINAEFLNDFTTMDRWAFIRKYMLVFPYATETTIDPSLYKDGYADLRGMDYYTVPSAKTVWNKTLNKAEIKRVIIGIRNVVILTDTLAFMKIFPNITIEHLIYCLAYHTLLYYDNTDGEITEPKFILDTAFNVYSHPEKYHFEPQIKRKFKIDKQYWIERGYNDWLEVTNIIRRKMRDNDFGSLYDFNESLEQNLSDMKDAGVKTTKRTLTEWLKNNGCNYYTEKDKFKNEVREFHCLHPEYSVRTIARLKGISPATVCRYLRDKGQ